MGAVDKITILLHRTKKIPILLSIGIFYFVTMGLETIKEILKEHPFGLTSKELHQELGIKNLYHELKLLEERGEIIQIKYKKNDKCPLCGHIRKESTWKLKKKN